MVKWCFDTRDERAARRARRDFATYVSQIYGAQADAAAAELVLGELIGNVARHAPGTARVQASFDDRGVTIAVHDSGSGFSTPPPKREISLLNESGRGLAIVSQFAESVAVEYPDDAGCCVRATLPLRPNHEPSRTADESGD